MTIDFKNKKELRAVICGVFAAWYVFMNLNMGGMKTKATSYIMSSFTMFPQFTVNTHLKKDFKTFAFIPGWSTSHLDDVDVQGINTLAFYDIPVDTDGTWYRDVSGYSVLQSEEAVTLFDQAHQAGKKVVVTLTQTDGATISSILNNPTFQQNFIDDTLAELQEHQLDGIAIDFEFKDKNLGPAYTSFIQNVSQQLHAAIPTTQVNVALYPEMTKTHIYDVTALSEASDNVYMMADDFAVSEVINNEPTAPVYSADENEYWKQVEAAESSFLRYVSHDKLIVETAWYGNGNNYHIYIPKEKPDKSVSHNTLSTPLDPQLIEALLTEVPVSARPAARINLPYIAEALEGEGILNRNVLSYAMATIEHETAGTFEPIGEFKGAKSARRNGYEGGTNYYGRGFIQLTHLRNYKKIGERIGLGDSLVQNPDAVMEPRISAKILAAFFRDNSVAMWAMQGNFVAARKPVNPDAQGWHIANLAQKYLWVLS